MYSRADLPQMPSSTSNGLSVHSASTEDVNGTGEDKIRNAANNSTIEQKYHDLQIAYNDLQDELKRMQHQDFNARNNDEGQSHYVVSAQFLDVFRLSTDWARDYFKIPFSAFQIDEHELFTKNLDGVLCGGCHWPKKKKMNVSHLVQAIVAELLARRILLPQFAGCSESTRHEFGQMYDAMLKENESNAHKWRATTFATYDRCDVWTPLGSPAAPEPISSLRQAFYKTVAEEIDAIVGPIARKHFPDRGDHEERFQRSMVFIEAAGNLAISLSKQAAKLEIMDKSWFERSQRVFISNDDKMKGRFAEEYEESEFRVDIILRPGFLKYGNDKGENLESHAVWIPAMLDLSEIKSNYEDAQETMNGDMPGSNGMVPHARPEQSQPNLLNGHTTVAESPPAEPVVPLPYYEHELHPRAPFQAGAATKPPAGETAGRRGKLWKAIMQAVRGGDSRTTHERRRDVVKKYIPRSKAWKHRVFPSS